MGNGMKEHEVQKSGPTPGDGTVQSYLSLFQPRSCSGRCCTLLEILSRVHMPTTEQRDAPQTGVIVSDSSLLEDLCQGCCPPEKPCQLKHLFMTTHHPDPRTLLQLKCAEIFYAGRHGARPASASAAMMEFVEVGYAKLFANIYAPGLRLQDIAEAVFHGGWTSPSDSTQSFQPRKSEMTDDLAISPLFVWAA